MIKIGFSCPESLEKMTKSSCGFYCDSCKKEVFDFRGLSHNEIREITQKEGVSCGIFDHNQAKADSRSIVRTIFRMAFAAVFILGFNASTLFGQISVSSDSSQVRLEENISAKIVVKGKIRDKKGNGIKGRLTYYVDDNNKGVNTDDQGNFEFEIDTRELGKMADIYFYASGKYGYHVSIESLESKTYIYEVRLKKYKAPRHVMGAYCHY